MAVGRLLHRQVLRTPVLRPATTVAGGGGANEVSPTVHRACDVLGSTLGSRERGW